MLTGRCLNVAGWAPGFWGQEAHEERDEERDEGSEGSKGSPGLVGFAIAMVALDQIESVFCSRDMEPRYGAHFLESYIMIRDK